MSKKSINPKKLTQNNPETHENTTTKLFKNPTSLQQFLGFISILLLLLFTVYNQFIFGKFVLLFKDIGSDSYNYTYPLFSHYAEYLRTEGVPQWSFQHGLGQNLYPFWFGPIRVILWFIFEKNIAESMIYIQIIHLFFSGIFFYLFLRNLSRSYLSAVVFTLFFVFSGYATLGGTWSPEVFPQELMQFSYLIFATQYFLKHNKWYFFPFAIALIAIYQPFNLYFAGIAVLVHILLYKSFESQIRINELSKLILILAGCGLLGLLLSSFQSVSNIVQLLDSPRVGGEFSYASKLTSKGLLSLESSTHYSTLILRIFSSDLFGTALTYRGWYNYMEAPVFYCGLLSVLLVPQIYVFSSYYFRKVIIGLTIFIGLICLFPFFRYSFWLFTGDYYRTICLLTIFLVLAASSKIFDAFIKNSRINIPVLVITFVVSIIVIFIAKPSLQTDFEKELLRIIFLILTVLLISIIVYIKTEFKKVSIVILLIVCLIELISFSKNSLYERKIVEKAELKNSGYNDATKLAIEFLHEKQKGFYRVEKNYSSGLTEHESFNDAHLQGYYGSRAYHSFNQANYVDFLRRVDLIKQDDEFGSRWLEGVMYEPYLQRLCSVNYYLTKLPNAVEYYKGMSMDSVTTKEDVKIFEINYSFPFGVAFDKYITESDFLKLNTNQRRKILLQAVVAPKNRESSFNGLEKISTIISSEGVNSSYLELTSAYAEKNSLKNLEVSNNLISGQISLSKPKFLFFSIPYDRGWKAFSNNQEIEIQKIDIGLTGVYLPAGNHQIRLVFQTPYLKVSVFISILAFCFYVGLIYYSINAKKTGTK